MAWNPTEIDDAVDNLLEAEDDDTEVAGERWYSALPGLPSATEWEDGREFLRSKIRDHARMGIVFFAVPFVLVLVLAVYAALFEIRPRTIAEQAAPVAESGLTSAPAQTSAPKKQVAAVPKKPIAKSVSAAVGKKTGTRLADNTAKPKTRK